MNEKRDLRDVVVEVLCASREKGMPITVLLSDSESTSRIAPFSSLYPDRVVNVGIAEQNLIGMAAGIALAGDVVVTANAAPFLLHRSYEQVRIDVCYNRMNVKMLGINAGIAYGSLGSTHHAPDDIAVIRCADYVQIFAPADPLETMQVMEYALSITDPVYIRMDSITVDSVHDSSYHFIPGAPDVVLNGTDVLICSMGTIISEALAACDRLKEQKIQPTLVNISSIRPLDRTALAALLRKHAIVVTVEEHMLHGGLASIVKDIIAEENISSKLLTRGVPESFPTLAGRRSALRSHYGLDTDSLVQFIIDRVREVPWNKRSSP